MFIIIMGVAGSGKTTVGRALAERLGCRFYDGDDFHPAANVAKMAAGMPLNDEDRSGWLAALAEIIRNGLNKGEDGVLACSALKAKYRAVLQVDPEQVRFVYLKGSYADILARLQGRGAHFMKAAMLASQFETLEEPVGAMVQDICLEPDVIVRNIVEMLTRKNR